MRDRPDHREVREGRDVWQKARSVQPNSQWYPGSHFSPSRAWFLKNTLSTRGRPPLEVLSSMHHGHHVTGFLLQSLPLSVWRPPLGAEGWSTHRRGRPEAPGAQAPRSSPLQETGVGDKEPTSCPLHQDSSASVRYWSPGYPQDPLLIKRRVLSFPSPSYDPTGASWDHLPNNRCACACSVVPTSVQLLDCSPPGSCVHRILQAWIPEWVAAPSSPYPHSNPIWCSTSWGEPNWTLFLVWEESRPEGASAIIRDNPIIVEGGIKAHKGEPLSP